MKWKGLIFALSLIFAVSVSGRTIAYFYALDEDWRKFAEVAGGPVENVTRSGFTFSRVRVNEEVVYGVKMGAGAVQTALSAQALLTLVPVDWVVSSGPVGALTESLRVGQTLRVGAVLAWQTLGTLDLVGAGRMKVLPIRDPEGDWAAALLPDYEVISVASGEAFVDTSELRERIHAVTEAAAVDMNLFGLISALDQRGLRSIHLRVVSDEADEKAAETFAAFNASYRGELGVAMVRLIQSLPADTTDPDTYPELRALFGTETR